MDDLVKHRLDMAADKLKSAKILLDERQYKDSGTAVTMMIFISPQEKKQKNFWQKQKNVIRVHGGSIAAWLRSVQNR